MPENTSPDVVITDYDLGGPGPEPVLTAAGLSAARSSSAAPDDLARAGAGARALIVQWATIDDAVLDLFPNLEIISRTGIGYDMIDVDAATRRGIAVANTPTYCIDEVAAHTLAMILSSSRGLHSYDQAVRRGQWAPTAGRPPAARPSSTMVGLLGLGRIGSKVAAACAALGFQVAVADPFVPDESIWSLGYEPLSRQELLARADIVSLHLPLTAETKHIIGRESLDSMKPGSVIVNTCRGPLIDEAALVDSLIAGRLAGAALDVFEIEPLPDDSALRALETVLLTPHAAWFSPQSLLDLPVHAATNVVDFLRGAPVPAIVNATALTAV